MTRVRLAALGSLVAGGGVAIALLTGAGTGGARQSTVWSVTPAWSPDGHTIAFARLSRVHGGTRAAIYLMNADGSHVRVLTHSHVIAFYPSWSPDGRTIAFTAVDRVRRAERTAVFVVDADGAHERQLTRGPNDYGPAWSPDGRTIAFTSSRHYSSMGRGDFNTDVYLMNADGNHQRRVTRNEALDGAPAWAPDGKRIVFSSDRDVAGSGKPSGWSIYVVNADGSGLHRLARTAPWWISADTDFTCAWSPDGRTIAFGRDRLTGADDNVDRELYLVNPDGSGLRRLTHSPGTRNRATDNPTWSPDGRQIAYQSTVSGHGQIWVMNADGSRQRRLTG